MDIGMSLLVLNLMMTAMRRPIYGRQPAAAPYPPGAAVARGGAQ
jgi:hypothetical protein